jgi:ATP-dependent DNA helicase RecG
LYVFYQNPSESYDQTPVVGASVNEVDAQALERYRVLRGKVNPNAEELNYNDQELLEALGCVVQEHPHQLNLAGVLLFGSYRLQRRVIPTMRVDYIRVPGNEWVASPDESFQSIDMLGPLMLLVFRLMEAVNADLPKGFALKEGELQAESKGLPPRVLREAIVNALMHRSYRVDRPTQIIRYNNRIEIINAGYSLKDEGMFNHPGSTLRNKIIAPVFHDTNLAEMKGSGIKRMRELMQEAQMVLPTMESNRADNSFTIRLLLHHLLDAADVEWLASFAAFDLNTRQKNALVFMREVGAIDNLTYRQTNNCDILRSSRELIAMRDMGLLSDKGRGSATHYIPGPAYMDTIGKLTSPLGTVTDGLNTHAEGLNTHAEGLNTHAEGLNTHAEETADKDNVELRQSLLLDLPPEIKERLDGIGRRNGNSLLIQSLILDLCRIHPMTKRMLAILLNRREDYIKQTFFSPRG